MSGLKGTLCEGIERELDKGIQMLKAADYAMNDAVSDILDAIDDFAPDPITPPSILDDALDDMNDLMQKKTPDMKSAEYILDLLEKCLGLCDDLSTKSDYRIRLDILDVIYDALNDVISDFFHIPEIFIAQGIDLANDLLSKIKVGDLLAKLDRLIDCIDAACGGGISDKVDTINALVDNMQIDDNGRIDQDNMFLNGGLSQAQQDAIEKAQNSMHIQKASSMGASNNAATAFINAIQDGAFPCI